MIKISREGVCVWLTAAPPARRCRVFSRQSPCPISGTANWGFHMLPGVRGLVRALLGKGHGGSYIGLPCRGRAVGTIVKGGKEMPEWQRVSCLKSSLGNH